MTREEGIRLLGDIVRSRPYNCFRDHLYTADELYEGYCIGEQDTYAESFDATVYRHYISTGKGSEADEIEQVARVLHDNAISRCMRSFLHYVPRHNVVGIMGGHGLVRTSADYATVAHISKRLTEGGALMISGGGPGAMEATHLGAWMGGRTERELEQALDIMSAAPTYRHPQWIDTQIEIRERFPQTTYKSLGLPTWLYGHEPPTLLATHIAKYFDNSIREDAILTIAYGGLIFVPGSAGTLQEAFQEAVQNHYLSLGESSPMAFYGTRFWTHDVPVYSLMQQLMQNGTYQNLLLSISDSADEIIQTIEKFREKNTEKE